MHEHTEHEILRELRELRHLLLRLLYRPVTGLTITQIGDSTMATNLLTISPGNAPQFQASLQPITAGPVVASQVAWNVTGDPGATVAQNASDSTGLTATLTLTPAVVLGASLVLTAIVTNPDGTTANASDTLTVVSTTAPPPEYTNVTGIAIQQIA